MLAVDKSVENNSEGVYGLIITVAPYYYYYYMPYLHNVPTREQNHT